MRSTSHTRYLEYGNGKSETIGRIKYEKSNISRRVESGLEWESHKQGPFNALRSQFECFPCMAEAVPITGEQTCL